MINIKIDKLRLTCKNSINSKLTQIIGGHFFDSWIHKVNVLSDYYTEVNL